MSKTNKKSITEIQNDIIEDFSFFENWEDKYDYLIQLGKSLKPIPEEDKEEAFLVKGCQSKVWLKADKKESNIITFLADSDALIPKGIAALLTTIYSGHNAEDILKANEGFIDKIGLTQFLSPTRANGLLSMLKQIKFYAIALSRKV